MKKIKHGDIAKELGMSRSQYDQTRAGRRKPTLEELEDLSRLYPEVLPYFSGIKEGLDDPVVEFFKQKGEEGDLVVALKKTIKAQEEVIAMLKDKLAHAKQAHADTLEALMSEDDRKILYEKVKRLLGEGF